MKGFTLLEIMIALAIMAGVLLTVISSFNYHLSLAARDREETIAALLARAKLDDPGFQKAGQEKWFLCPGLAGHGVGNRSHRRTVPGYRPDDIHRNLGPENGETFLSSVTRHGRIAAPP